MSPAALFIIFIAFIYLITLLLKRWRRMSDRHSTFNAIITLGAFWAVVFFGVLTLSDVPSFEKYEIDAIISVGFFVFGLVYFNAKRFRAIVTIILSKGTKIAFWLVSIVECIDVVFLFYFGVINWNIVTINDIPVVTFYNVLAFGSILLGTVFFINLIRRLARLISKGLYW